jgi:ribosome maturation factor RimP
VVRREQDFRRFAGQRMRITLRLPIEGRTRVLVGDLLAFDGGQLTVRVDQKTHTVDFATVEKARLVPVFQGG